MALAGLAALVCSIAPALPVAAQDVVPAEVYVILAADAPGTIDERLASLPGLREGPFGGFGSMSLVELHTASLAIGAPHDVTLPNGRVLRVVIESVADDGRYRVRVVINRPGETDYLPHLAMLAAPGVPLFFAGQRLDTGALIIALRLGAAAAGSGSSAAPSLPASPEAPVGEPASAATPDELACEAAPPAR